MRLDFRAQSAGREVRVPTPSTSLRAGLSPQNWRRQRWGILGVPFGILVVHSPTLAELKISVKGRCHNEIVKAVEKSVSELKMVELSKWDFLQKMLVPAKGKFSGEPPQGFTHHRGTEEDRERLSAELDGHVGTGGDVRSRGGSLLTGYAAADGFEFQAGVLRGFYRTAERLAYK